MRTSFRLLVCIAAVILSSASFAQEATPQSSPPPPLMVTATSQGSALNASPAPETQAMDKMATTVTRAAEMCEMMMKKEMAAAPAKMAAGIAVGALLLIAVVFFVILEVQWIIYWSRLLKAQKRSGQA